MSGSRRRRQPLPLAPDGLPYPLRWRPVVPIGGLMGGALLCTGGLLLLQQLGETTLEPAGVASAIGIGVVLGIVFPSVGRLYGVWRSNVLLRRMREELAQEREQAGGATEATA